MNKQKNKVDIKELLQGVTNIYFYNNKQDMIIDTKYEIKEGKIKLFHFQGNDIKYSTNVSFQYVEIQLNGYINMNITVYKNATFEKELNTIRIFLN